VQPGCISSLPTELRTLIWSYVGSASPYSAFIMVVNETSRLVYHLRDPFRQVVSVGRVSRLSAQMVSVFGTSYIQTLNHTRRDDVEDTQNLVETTGLRYIRSCGGICAIQLFGMDWKSDWIGEIPTGNCIWYGELLETGRALSLFFDTNPFPMSSNEISAFIAEKFRQIYQFMDMNQALSCYGTRMIYHPLGLYNR
jgi:hypothetical protein